MQLAAVEPVITVGHATRSLEQLVDLLEAYGVQHLVDARGRPATHRSPHFSVQHLARALPARDIAYTPMPDLGERRDAIATRPASPQAALTAPVEEQQLAELLTDLASPNAAWQDPALRAYADYMGTPVFAWAAEALQAQACQERIVLMCEEPIPWRCHRQLISDWLVAHGHEVWHLVGGEQPLQHKLNPAARCMPDGSLIYPDSDQLGLPS